MKFHYYIFMEDGTVVGTNDEGQAELYAETDIVIDAEKGTNLMNGDEIYEASPLEEDPDDE